jgi:hypothetical protein
MKFLISKAELKVWGKAIGYVSVAMLAMTGLSYATLDVQITKVSDIVLGNMAALLIGGGLVVGGGYSCYLGDIPKGLAQIGVAGAIGIVTALVKSKAIFNILD